MSSKIKRNLARLGIAAYFVAGAVVVGASTVGLEHLAARRWM